MSEAEITEKHRELRTRTLALMNELQELEWAMTDDERKPDVTKAKELVSDAEMRLWS